jgi:hypothetical protein
MHLDVKNNDILGPAGGESVIALTERFTNLDRLDSCNADRGYIENNTPLTTDQQRFLDLLLDRKRQCTEAQALAGSPFPVLFRAMEQAHRHEHDLGAILMLLQNDGDDHFYTALNREIE